MSNEPVNSSLSHEVRKDISVVPWYNTAQFKKVHASLYSSDLSKKRWAVDQISVWETRCHPSLSTAIEASVVISTAMIQDILFTNGATLCQELDIRLMYSMALVRFVNLIIEALKKCNPNKATTAQIAKGLGIPSWIVDLRNEATHSFLPSLPSLRLAAESAMKYLKESFWEKEVSILKDFEKEPFNEGEVNKLIVDYVEEQQSLRDDRNFSPIKRFDGAVKKLEPYILKYKRQFINVLVSGGIFIPMDSDILQKMSYPEFIPFQERHDENGTEPKIIPPLPIEFEFLWETLLQVLHKNEAIPLLLEALLKSQPDRSLLRQKIAASWVMKILQLQLGNCFEDTILKNFFKYGGMTVNWHRMMYAALCRPCVYTPFIFPLIFSRLKLKKKVTRNILHLLAIALGHADWKAVELPRNYTIKSVEDLKQMKQLQSVERRNETRKSDECIWSEAPVKQLQSAERRNETRKSDECIWFEAPDTRYMSWPIGFVIKAVDDDELADDPCEDFIPVEDLDENMDSSEKYFLGNENDNEEEDSLIDDEPNSSEDEMELCERRTFLYRKK